VLVSGRFDIISDASPSVGEITIGTRVVCASQINRQGHASFIEGEIMQILNDTKQFVVRTIASDEVKTVKRAQIRLLQPPWWDELNDTNTLGDGSTATRVITGQIKQLHGMDTNMYSNTMAGAVIAAAAGGNTLTASSATNATNNRTMKYMATPLQVHHLLPTVQTSEEHYRTAATSPFPNAISSDHTVPNVHVGSHQSNTNQIPEIIVSQQTVNTTILSTAPGGATIERGMPPNEIEIRRHQRPYDEYDSDDELRREDISFTIDGGEKNYFLL